MLQRANENFELLFKYSMHTICTFMQIRNTCSAVKLCHRLHSGVELLPLIFFLIFSSPYTSMQVKHYIYDKYIVFIQARLKVLPQVKTQEPQTPDQSPKVVLEEREGSLS